MEKIKLYKGDCLDIMKDILDGSVDLILSDLPYSMTSMDWDCHIPFEPLWKEYKRIIKPSGNIVLFSSGLFTFKLAESNISMFKYRLIWKKNVPTGMSSAKYRPMKYFEEICVFNEGTSSTYNPQKKERVGIGKSCYNYDHYCGDNNHIKLDKKPKRYDPDFVNPSDVLEFNVVPNRNGKYHPTQKPVPLLEYLIKTYSNGDDVVLDNAAGSMSTAIAAINVKRKCICIEKDEEYFNLGKKRVDMWLKELGENLANV